MPGWTTNGASCDALGGRQGETQAANLKPAPIALQGDVAQMPVCARFVAVRADAQPSVATQGYGSDFDILFPPLRPGLLVAIVHSLAPYFLRFRPTSRARGVAAYSGTSPPAVARFPAQRNPAQSPRLPSTNPDHLSAR